MPRKAKSARDGVYQRKDRDGYWISWIDAQGKRRYRRTGAQTIAEAKRARAGEIQRVEQAKALGFNPPGEEMFAETAKRFLAHQKARLTRKAFEREDSIINLHLGTFFSGRLASVRRVDVQRYVTRRSGEVSAHSVQKELNVLKHLMRLAVEWELIPFNPAQGVRPPKVPAGRVRYLQPTELRALLVACPEWLRAIVALAVTTGMRRGEILGVRRMDLDLHNNRIMLAQTKNGTARIVYLNKSARAVMDPLGLDREGKPTDKLFSGHKPEWVSVAFQRVCGDLEISDFRFHDLRHTAASWLRMSGADIHTVAELLGHRDLRMAARYQHLSPAFLGEGVERLDGVLGIDCYQDVTTPKALPASAAVTN